MEATGAKLEDLLTELQEKGQYVLVFLDMGNYVRDWVSGYLEKGEAGEWTMPRTHETPGGGPPRSPFKLHQVLGVVLERGAPSPAADVWDFAWTSPRYNAFKAIRGLRNFGWPA